jgi:hypothetical protein
MAKAKKSNAVGVITKGMVIKGQGTVPYNAPVEVSTPNVAKAVAEKGKCRGAGAMLRGTSFTY